MHGENTGSTAVATDWRLAKPLCDSPEAEAAADVQGVVSHRAGAGRTGGLLGV
jgi:hypothetical protein